MDRSDGAAESLPGMGSQSGLKLVDDMSPPTSREWLILGYHRSGRGCRGASEAIRRSGRRSIAGVDRILRPGAVDVVHIEAARCRHGIDIELQRCLADAGRGRNRRQIEFNVTDLRSTDIEQISCPVIRGRIGGVGERVAQSVICA